MNRRSTAIRNRFAFGAVMFVITAAVGCAATGTQTRDGGAVIPREALDRRWDPSRLSFPELGTIPEVDAERFVLDNGMVVYIVRDAEFPDVSANLMLRGGTSLDPPALAGLGRLTASVLRTGGSTRVDGDALDERLQYIGATVETSSDATSANARVQALREHADEALAVLADILMNPAFPEDKLDLARSQIRRQISARNDEPGQIARRVIRHLVWGEESPYFREVEFATLDAITTGDLREFHRRYYVPDRAILTLSGDIEPEAMKPRLAELFGAWRPSTEPLPPSPPVPAIDEGGVFYVPKEQMTQSYVYVGQIGIRADNPDYPAMEVLGELLGGGFASRIVTLIRTQRGLAYAAGAGAGVGFAHPGTFTAFALTRSDSTVVTLDLLQGEVRRIVEVEPSEDEVRIARESLLNSFVFNFRSRGQVAARSAFYEFYGYPEDFLTVYQERLRQVTPEDVHRAARTYLAPDRMKVLIVGSPEEVRPQLDARSGLRFQEVDITIPGAGAPPGGAQRM